MNAWWHRFALVGSLGGLWAAPAVAQRVQPVPAAEGSASSFQDVVHTYLVNVEVWVADGRGRPIAGLTAADFELFEDGEPVEVTHFAETRGRSLPTASLAPLPGAPEGTAPADEGGHLVLYFDFTHLSQAGAQQIVRDLRKFISSEKVPASQIMILAQDRALATVAPFGSTPEQLEATLDSLAEADPVGALTDREKRLALKRLQHDWDLEKQVPGRDPCERFVPRALAEIEDFAARRSDRVRNTLDSLAAVAGYLSALPGLKTLIYLGDQLETTPGRGMLTFIDAVCPPALRDDLTLELSVDLVDRFEHLTAHANTNRVTFYPFQTGGLETSLLMSAEMPSTDFLSRGGLIDASMRGNERTGLAFIAAQTGGRTVFNRNRFETELATVAEEMESYYSLAYVPPHGGDGRTHRIEVKVRDGVSHSPGGPPAKRVEVRYRRGYRDKGDDVRMAERIEAVAHLGLVSNPLEVRLGAGSLELQEDGTYRLPLHVLVPSGKPTYLPGAEAPQAQLELVATAYDAQDQVVFSTRSNFEVGQPPAGEPTTLDLVADLQIGPGRHVVVVGLRDRLSREASYVSTAVEIAH
jgi:VWFA-related protein